MTTPKEIRAAAERRKSGTTPVSMDDHFRLEEDAKILADAVLAQAAKEYEDWRSSVLWVLRWHPVSEDEVRDKYERGLSQSDAIEEYWGYLRARKAAALKAKE